MRVRDHQDEPVGRGGGDGRSGRNGVAVAQALADHLGDAITAHRYAVQGIGDLHRALLVRHDDELGGRAQLIDGIDETPRLTSSRAASTSSST